MLKNARKRRLFYLWHAR